MKSLKVFLLFAAVANAFDYRYYDKSVPELADDIAIFVHVMLDPCGGRCEYYEYQCKKVRRMHNCFKTASTVEEQTICFNDNCLQPTTSCTMWRLYMCYKYCILRKC